MLEKDSSVIGVGAKDLAVVRNLEVKLEALTKANERKDEEIENLNEKVNYLRNLLVKMENRLVFIMFVCNRGFFHLWIFLIFINSKLPVNS